MARTLLLLWARHEKTATATLCKTAISTEAYTVAIFCSVFKPCVHLYPIKHSNMEVGVLTQISCAPAGVLLELLSTKIRCVAVRYRVPCVDLLLKRSRSRTCSTCKWAQSQKSSLFPPLGVKLSESIQEKLDQHWNTSNAQLNQAGTCSNPLHLASFQLPFPVWQDALMISWQKYPYVLL